ncbi:hypothetical protein L195_g063467, partial [Trifolium pratense]
GLDFESLRISKSAEICRFLASVLTCAGDLTAQVFIMSLPR